MKKLSLILSFFVICVTLAHAQTAEYSAPPIKAKFTSDAPTELLIMSPSYLQEEEDDKTRGFTKVNTNKITIQGKVTDPNGVKSLLINDFGVHVEPDGSFEQELPLSKGQNIVAFLVTDDKANLFEKRFTLMNEGGTEAAPVAGIGSPKYYALLIGINEYEDEMIPDLDKPIKDAEALAEILKSYYTFDEENITLLKNATRGDIIVALDEFQEKITPNDNLLMFYAGHGLWDPNKEIGYWIPSDGASDNTVDYFRNSTLTDQIGAIKSKHTLLIADACFSGAIFQTRRAFFDASTAVNKLYEQPSRKAMTSGTLTEVPDRSAFLEYLTKRLKSNSEKYMSAATLFSNIRETVINNSDVIPQYGTMQKVGDEGGEFIFIRRD